MTNRKFFRTIIQIEVLSEDVPIEYSNLSDLNYLITEGDCSGKVECLKQEEVSPVRMAQMLLSQGSDPAFFKLSFDGEDLED